MTLETKKPTAGKFRLIDHGAGSAPIDYEEGGTDLGIVLTHATVGFERGMTNLTGAKFAGAWIEGIDHYENVILEVVLGARSAEVLKLAHRAHHASGAPLLLGPRQARPGAFVVEEGLTTRLQIRPLQDDGDASEAVAHTFLPHAYCIAIGPRQYSVRGKMLDAAVLTIVGYLDADLGAAVFEGAASAMPVYEEPE